MEEKLQRYWQMQEMLLQNYRLIFWGIQTSLLISSSIVGAVSSHPRAFYVILLIMAWVLLRFGMKVIKARAMDVSYFQMLILKAERGEFDGPVLSGFKEWQKLPADVKRKTLIEGGIFPSFTRKVFEFWMPLIYFSVWLAMGWFLIL